MLSTEALGDDRVMSLVELALSRPPQERGAFLQSACAGDAELFGAVWKYVQAEERMRGFLLDPLAPPIGSEHPFTPGDLVDDRFRILREVARGGMGVVYEAVDEKLERRIAIKCARAGFHRRLPPEVRNAREITHPNVCKIFDVHTASTSNGEIDFVTMEFLDGETLAARLSREPLPEPEARAIARQLCAGVAEAHRNKVVHGDLKPNNIILVRDGDGTIRPVVMDFGLARGVDVAQSGEAGGTPAYMAPELWKGEKASIASDIYALGLILFELVAGRPPHPLEQSWPGVSWEKRLSWKPPSVHPKWDRILSRCLDPDPARRFASAAEIEQALAPARSRRKLVAAALLVSAVAAALTIAVSYKFHPDLRTNVRLALLPFETESQNAADGDNLVQGTGRQLARIKGGATARFTFIPLRNAETRKVETAAKARTLLGATHVLHGKLTSENGKLLLDAYLTDTDSMVDVKEWRAEYKPGEVRYVPFALAGIVTGALHLPHLPVVRVDRDASLDYLAGAAYLGRNSTIDSALPLLERAVATDPDSPFTWAGLAQAQWFKYFRTQDRFWLNRMAESNRQAGLRDPDLADVHWITGLLRADAGAYEMAEAEYQRAIEIEPDDGDAWRWMGVAYQSNNQLSQALTAFRKAVEVEPGNYRNHLALGGFFNSEPDYEEAAKHFRMAVDIAPDESDTHLALALAWLNSGLLAQSEKEYRRALSLRETTTALHSLGVNLMLQGRDPEAIPYIERALHIGPARYLWLMNLGIAYRRVNRMAESLDADRRGLKLAELESQKNPRDGHVRSVLAYLCARLNDQPSAEFHIGEAMALSPNDADTRYMAAMTWEALHQRENTLSVLSDSPYEVIADIGRYPDLADLHQDPRFKQLLAIRRRK